MENEKYMEELCIKAKNAGRRVANLTTNQKNEILRAMAKMIKDKGDYIIKENKKDLKTAEAAGVTKAFMDRLMLNHDRLESMAMSIEEIAMLEDPIGRVEEIKTRPSGIRVGRMRVPIGVIAVVYESRPNVTTDIAALAVKSGNAAILRGGKESIHSNTAIHKVIQEALNELNIPVEAVSFIDRTDHILVDILLRMDQSIDIVIPRGGENLIKMVTEKSTIPVIKHDKGVCHTFVDSSAEKEMANAICVNAKVQRPGVCNAMETLLIHKDYPHKESLLRALIDNGVQIRGCTRTVDIMPGNIETASPEDWGYEFLDLILAVKTVDSIEDAIFHITEYGSGHSEAIITSDYGKAERFLKEVDSSAVFVNSSTRFHDGGEFGLGAEVGISTQKLHARGTMGIEGLTCLKYIVYGTGQVRN